MLNQDSNNTVNLWFPSKKKLKTLEHLINLAKAKVSKVNQVSKDLNQGIDVPKKVEVSLQDRYLKLMMDRMHQDQEEDKLQNHCHDQLQNRKSRMILINYQSQLTILPTKKLQVMDKETQILCIMLLLNFPLQRKEESLLIILTR